MLALAASASASAETLSLGEVTDTATKPQSDKTTLKEVLVTADKLEEGSAAAGYLVDAPSSLGPLGKAKLVDIPNSMSILPAALIENVQATSVKEALKYVPLAQFQEQQGPQVLRPATRGMQGSNYQNTRLDGMTIFVTGANPIESLQQIEVFSGVPAALYGPSNPAGVFNFVSKRPTNQPLKQLNIGYDSSSIYTVHGDVSGKIGESDVVGYRLNLLDAGGSGYVSGSQLERQLASLAVDVHPTRDTTVELDLSSYHLSQKGYPGWFTYSQTTKLPDAPDPTKAGYGQSYAGVDLKNKTESIRLKHDFESNWHLVIGGLSQNVDRNINTPVNNLTNNTGSYTSSLANGFAPRFQITSNIAYLNGGFNTGEISHDLTLGTTGFKANSYAAIYKPTAASVLLGSANISNPLVFSEPTAGLPDVSNQYKSSEATQQGINVSDLIAFSKEWSVKMSLSQDRMKTQNYTYASSTGAVPSTNYSANGLSSMPSLIYKPLENVTTYLTYSNSLQQGDIATSGVNVNQGMAPYRSKQIEVGTKIALSQLNLSLALFQLERPFAPTVSATSTQIESGQQVNKGLEATATGKLTDRVVVTGGITLLDPIMKNTGNALSEGKQYVGMPKVKSNLLFEYQVPSIPALVATFDWQYTARRPADDANLYWAPSYNVFDLGARYAMGKATTFRLAVNNLTNVHYWSTIGPSTITGANTGSMTAHLGAPRTVAASVAVNF
jgi:iron complex outermembrane receptor protein